MSSQDSRSDVLAPATYSCSQVSVVIPCWNAEKWIARSIQSGLDQENIDVEIIVIDDGSADQSLDVIKSFGDRVKWRTGPNQGACTARNRGLELACGEFIMFLDADDYIEAGSMTSWLSYSSDADLVLCPFAYETNGRRTLGQAPSQPVNAESILREWLEGRFIPSCSVLWRRSFLQLIGGWNAEVLRNQDGELAIRGLLNGARVRVADQGLGVYVQHDHPDRVSKRVGREVLACQLRCSQKLYALAQAKGHKGIEVAFARSFYSLAYEAFANGVDDVGQIALARARELGLKGHPGSFVHGVLSHVLGLKNKLRVTGMLKGRSMIRGDAQVPIKPPETKCPL
jgi:glycosyltransferase involved in cell wall biosynthesis